MIDDYRKVADSIKVSEELKDATIMKIKSGENKNKKIYPYKISTAVICIFIAVVSILILYKTVIYPNSKFALKSRGLNEKSIVLQRTKGGKETKKYPPNTVQARLLKEEAISFNESATTDRVGPIYKNIKDLYENSSNVIKGYVYSTDYFWLETSGLNLLYTKSVVTIEKSYKGTFKAGDKVTVIEHGGVTTLGEWIEKTSVKEYKSFEKIPEDFDPYNGKSPQTLIDYGGFYGISTMRTGQEVVLFLSSYDNKVFGNKTEMSCTITGPDGGKMVLINGVYKSQISFDCKDIVKDESCAENDIGNVIKSAQGRLPDH